MNDDLNTQAAAPVSEPAESETPASVEPVTETTPPEPVALAIPEVEFSVNAAALKSAVRAVERALGKTMPILGMFHVYADSEQERLAITATNLDTTLTRYVPATLTTAGEICLPRILAPLTANLDDEQSVRFTLNPKTITARVQSLRVASVLNGLPATEFPTCSPYANDAKQIGTLSLTRDELDEVAKRVIPFIGDESRPVLAGIHITATALKGNESGSTIKFTGADGFRLVELTKRDVPFYYGDVKPGKDAKLALDVIVPGRFLVEALRLADESVKLRQQEDADVPGEPEMFEIEFFAVPQPKPRKDEKEKIVPGSPDGFVALTTANGEVLCHLVEGTYPDTNKLIRAEGKLKTIPLPVDETLGALASASVFASDSMQQVRIACQVPEQRIIISASSSASGVFTEVIESPFDDNAPADQFEVALNVRYLTEIVRAATFGDGDAPAKLQVTASDKPVFVPARNFRSVLMPMHLDKPEPKPAPEPVAEKASDPDPVSQQDMAAEQVVEGSTTGARIVTCPCGAELEIIAGGAEICDKCQRIIDDQGNVLDA